MKTYIKLKDPSGDVKNFRTDEKPMMWKILGGLMLAIGMISLCKVPYSETMYEKVYNIVDGVINCYLGLYSMRELCYLRKIIIKSLVLYRGYVPADDVARKYLDENIM